MNEYDEDRVKQSLKHALPPVADAESTGDLWPVFLRRLEDEREQSLRWIWFDCALAVGLVAFVSFAPAAIPVLLYYL